MKRLARLVLIGGSLAILGGLGLMTLHQEQPTTQKVIKKGERSLARGLAALRDLPKSVLPRVRGCGEGYAAEADGFCLPIDPKTGTVYSAERLQEYQKLVSGSLVNDANLFVPLRRTVEEVEAQNAETIEMNDLREKIKDAIASEEEIETFYRYREALFGMKLQLIHAMHVESGGGISMIDPSLDPELIKDPTVRKAYEQLRREQGQDYEQHKFARTQNGLKAEVFAF